MDIKQKYKDYNVGVIVGRFQSPELHEAHKELIQYVLDRHDKVYIFLGISLVYSIKNPYDFEIRRKMIQEDFPMVNILSITDMPGQDENWSKMLDFCINTVTANHDKVLLYGSRDSFIPSYKGRYQTQELVPSIEISATELRQRASRGTLCSRDFRCGVIWSYYNRFPICYPTVDIAIFKQETNEILLGRKPGKNKYQFIGGFCETRSNSNEEDAKREVIEETGLEVSDLEYIGSSYIDDIRYKGLRDTDCIRTTFYLGYYIYGSAKGNDDIEETKWFTFKNLEENYKDLIEKQHHVLMELLIAKKTKFNIK